MPSPDPPNPHPPLRLTPWLGVKFLLPLGLGAVLVSIAEEPVQLLVTAILVPIVTLGLVGRHGLTSDESRLPGPLQGVCLGIYVGVAVTTVVLGAWDWSVVVWILPLTVLFPGALPSRLRRPLLAKVTVDEDAVRRARWNDRHDAPT